MTNDTLESMVRESVGRQSNGALMMPRPECKPPARQVLVLRELPGEQGEMIYSVDDLHKMAWQISMMLSDPAKVPVLVVPEWIELAAKDYPLAATVANGKDPLGFVVFHPDAKGAGNA